MGHMASGQISADSVFLAMYAYNTYTSAMASWAAYTRRRATLGGLNSLLPDATQAQIDQQDDVRAFCWEDMAAGSAKLTPCNHIFHTGCLHRWLLIHQTCPKCRAVVLEGGEGAQ